MTKSKRMKPLAKVVESRERTAARVLGEQRRMLNEAETRLTELLGYRDEYAKKFEFSGGASIDARRMQDFRVFISRLNEAIIHQQLRVEHNRKEYEARRHQWYATRTKTRAVDKIIDRYRGDEARVAERREQAESDDRSTRVRVDIGGEDD